MEHDVAGACPLRRLDEGRRVRREVPRCLVEPVLENPVAAETWDEQIAIRRVDDDRVRVRMRRDDLDRPRLHQSLLADRLNRDRIARIGRAEQEPPGPVGREVGRVVRQRRGREERQRAGRRVDRESRDRKGGRTERGVEEPAARADREGHDRAGHRHPLDEAHRAGPVVEGHDMDLPAVGVRDIDHSRSHYFTEPSARPRTRCRSTNMNRITTGTTPTSAAAIR